MLQSVKLQGTIRYDSDKIRCVIQLKQRGHLHTKTVELESNCLDRNRTALDIKSRFVFIYEEALV